MSSGLRKLAGVAVPPVGFGCMALSQSYFPLPDRSVAFKILHEALDLGYVHLDTARLYGLGHNENLVSDVLKHRRDSVFLATKCGIEQADGRRWIDGSPENIRASCEVSLSVLGVEHIDLFYLHRRDPQIPIEESVGALGRLYEEGKIGAIGLSEVSADTLRRASRVHPIAAVQSEYSLWTRNPEIAVLQACQELEVAFVAFSPVGRGALAGGITEVDGVAKLSAKDLRFDNPRFLGENWARNKVLIDEFTAIANREGVTSAQLALAWVLAQGPNIHAIPSTANVHHLKENWASAGLNISPMALTRAGEVINQRTVRGHRYSAAMREAIDTEEF